MGGSVKNNRRTNRGRGGHRRGEHLQRLVNEQKRRQLSERYGAVFPRGPNPLLPPEIEAEWLDHILEFEQQHASSGQISLHQYIGSPVVVPVDGLSAERIEAELARLLSILAENQVFIDFPQGVESDEAYRLIVEELLGEMVDNIRIPGLHLHFVCEESHDDRSADESIF